MSNKEKTYQDWVLDSLEKILNDEQYDEDFFRNTQGVLYAIKNGMICHYANNQSVDDESIINYFKSLKKIEDSKILISEKAREVYNNAKIKNKFDKTLGKDKLYFEHIIPNSFIWEQLLKLKTNNKTVSRTKIKECFKGHKLLLITKEEAEKLDKNIKSNKSKTKFEITSLSNEQLIRVRFEGIKMSFYDFNDKKYTTEETIKFLLDE